MKREARARDVAGAEVVGALVLFGIFVTTLAVLNVTAVPAAGFAAEEEHFLRTLNALNALQTEAEGAGSPHSVGATIARSLELGPTKNAPKDFFSYFLATPAQASGELAFAPDYGNITVTHEKADGVTVEDIGSATRPFPYGRFSFDPHPIFRDEGLIQLELGGIVTTGAGSETMRFAPPVTVSVSGSSTLVAIKARILNGTGFDIGGVAPIRVGLVTEAATLVNPAVDNARSVTLRIETPHGAAWGGYLNATAADAGLAAGAGFTTTVHEGNAAGRLDVVTWTIHGLSGAAEHDVRLTTGLAVYRVWAS